MTRLVHGVGINDRTYPASIKGKNNKEYDLWTSMLKRCYSEKVHVKQPTYVGCTVSDNFKHYAYFFEWCQTQIGFNASGYTLDKDLIIKGNKIYSEDNCLFLPQSLNKLLTKRQLHRGGLPIGVTKSSNNNYMVRCKIDGSENYLGVFNTPELAFNAYKTFKEAHIKEVAEKYKDTIDPRAYKALISYEVHIDD